MSERMVQGESETKERQTERTTTRETSKPAQQPTQPGQPAQEGGADREASEQQAEESSGR